MYLHTPTEYLNIQTGGFRKYPISYLDVFMSALVSINSYNGNVLDFTYLPSELHVR